MKVIVNRARLAEALSLVSSVAVARTPRPILQCVRLQANDGAEPSLTLFGTDLEIGFRVEIKEVQIKEPGQTVAHGAKLSAIIHDVTDETVTINTNQDNLEILASGSKFKLFTFDPNEFPPVSPKEEGKIISLNAGDLLKMAALCVFAAAKETTRYAINGLLLEAGGNKAMMVGTDGRRLSRITANLATKEAESISTIIPTRTVSLLSRFITDPTETIKVRIADNQVAFELSNSLMISSVVEGKYPAYESIIPKDSLTKVKIDRQGLLASVRRASLLASQVSRGVKMEMTKDRMVIEAHSPEEGEAAVELPIELDGEPMHISFNPDYLIDPLKVLSEDHVILELRAPNTPALLKAGTNFNYVLMPVTI
jgi:DNA polymerase-3 subunit beta